MLVTVQPPPLHSTRAQTGCLVMKQGDNTATTLAHGSPLQEPNEIIRSYGKSQKPTGNTKNPCFSRITADVQ